MATTIDDRNGGIHRRDFIYIGTGAFAALGAAAAIWPVIDQLNPDASTLAQASIEVDLAPIQAGQAITVLWRGKPLFIRNRTPEEVEKANAVDVKTLKDPDAEVMGTTGLPATDENRTKKNKQNWLVLIGVCTHLGCIPKGQTAGDDKGPYGGWFCPCHGSAYDTSGRIRQGPAPRNLEVPPYRFIEENKIKVG
jgi:ubiquinol-cytochrome c reductase iron-sulfur subunit